MLNTLEAAMSYAARGWHVVPIHTVGPDGVTCSCERGANCTSKGKHPIHRAWQDGPAPSGPDIHATWESRARTNVGLAAGTKSGFWVLDVDPDSGGMETMDAMLELGTRALPATYRVRTPSGGWHFYWLLPDDFTVTNSRGRIKDYGGGVDVRGDGGQVVASPSSTHKGAYEVTNEAAIVRAPAWLEDLIRPVVPATPASAAVVVRDPSQPVAPRLVKYVESAVSGLLERLDALSRLATADGAGYKGEPWNETCFEVACSLWELANADWNDFNIDHAVQCYATHAPSDVGFGALEQRKIWESAGQKIGTKARALPPSLAGPDDDDLLNGPDVKDRSSSRPKGDAPAGDAGATNNGGPERFFGHKDALLATRLRDGVMEAEPIGWGADEQFWVYRGGVWLPDRKIVRRRCVELLGDKYRKGHVETVNDPVAFAATQLENVPHQEWMNFTNGMLRWEDLEIVEHDPGFQSTVQFPLAWEPEAECPQFDAFLDQILHPDYVALAWEMIGYLMMSGNPQQIAFMLYGGGGNGKGTLLRVIQAILGKQNVARETLTKLNTDKFSPINLFGKIANIAGDIDGTYQESTAAFKSLTGEDEYGGERKFGDRVTFESWAVPVFSANKIPGSADVTDGYLRRWVVLKFDRQFKGEDKILGLSDILVAEAPGIAAKAVRALQVMMERGLFDVKGEALNGMTEFAENIDQVRQWRTAKTIPAPNHFESADALYRDYRSWSEQNNQGKLGKLEFTHRLTTIGIESRRIADVPGFVGLRVEGQPAAIAAAFWEGSV